MVNWSIAKGEAWDQDEGNKIILNFYAHFIFYIILFIFGCVIFVAMQAFLAAAGLHSSHKC